MVLLTTSKKSLKDVIKQLERYFKKMKLTLTAEKIKTFKSQITGKMADKKKPPVYS